MKPEQSKIFFAQNKVVDPLEYVEDTIQDAYNFHVVWDFDEQQADPFHQNWSGRTFLSCLRKVMSQAQETVDEAPPPEEDEVRERLIQIRGLILSTKRHLEGSFTPLNEILGLIEEVVMVVKDEDNTKPIKDM